MGDDLWLVDPRAHSGGLMYVWKLSHGGACPLGKNILYVIVALNILLNLY
jgi:hypothetical protein